MTAVERATAIFQVLDSLSPDNHEAAVEIIKIYERGILRETIWRARPR